MNVFFVESKIPEMNQEMLALIPSHRRYVEELFSNGVLKMYAVSEDRTRWWCAIKASDEMEVMDILSQMPIIDFLKPEIHSLMFFDEAVSELPGYSLN